eukprot:5310438-Pyramimonas_sp.AAC.1
MRGAGGDRRSGGRNMRSADEVTETEAEIRIGAGPGARFGRIGQRSGGGDHDMALPCSLAMPSSRCLSCPSCRHRSPRDHLRRCARQSE